MKLSILKGATSVLCRVFFRDSSSTTGGGLTGLTNASSGLVCYRARDDDGNAAGTAISLGAGTRGTWSSGGFVEKDATNMPGWYEFGIPNAAIATGSRSVDIHFKGATNLAPCPVEIELTGWDNQDATRGGMTALPNANANASGGLVVIGTGSNNFKSDSSANVTFANTSIATVTTVTNQLTAAQIATGIFQDTTAGDFTVALSIGKSIMNGVTLGTGLTVNAVTGLTASNLDTTVSSRMATYTQPTGFLAANFTTGIPISGDLTATMKTSVTTAATAATPTAAAVTGAVGSVAGQTLANLDAAVSSRASATVAPSWYTAPVDVSANVSAIKAKTDSLTFTTPNVLDSNVLYVHNIQVKGAGTNADPWNPV